MGTVIQFPSKKEYSNELYAKEFAQALITQVSATLHEFGFDPRDPELFDDLGVVVNVLNAALCRKLGVDHFMHDSLKIMSANLKEAAEKQHNDNN
jgi:hypothetical protein